MAADAADEPVAVAFSTSEERERERERLRQCSGDSLDRAEARLHGNVTRIRMCFVVHASIVPI